MELDAIPAPLRAVDARGRLFFVVYDRLRRPIEEWVSPGGPGGSGGQAEVLLTKRVWGDGLNQDVAGGERKRGRLVRVYDGGGETRSPREAVSGVSNPRSKRCSSGSRVERAVRRA